MCELFCKCPILEGFCDPRTFIGVRSNTHAKCVGSCFSFYVYVAQGLHSKRQQTLEDMKKIASSERGFRKYKDKLRNVDPPCVPFLGMYMTWIVFIKDGNEDKIHGMPDNFINFKKR